MKNYKLLAMLLAVAMVLSAAMTGCTGDGNETTGANESTGATGASTAPSEEVTQPTEPEEPAIYNGLTASQLDAIPSITAEEFQSFMDVTWNFGWEGDGTLEHNATKVDFDGTADASSKLWKLGTVGEEGTVLTDNAGWGVMLWTKGAGNTAFLYSKVDVPETVTQFRIWAVGNTSNDWSGAGSIRAVALYQDENGEYVKLVLEPTEDTFTGNLTTTWDAESGTVNFSDAVWSIPDVLDGCMLVYNMDALKGRSDVVIVIESIGLGATLGDEYTEAAEGVPAGEVMPEVVIVKRVMFL